MPVEITIIAFQSFVIKGQLPTAFRREDLILDGTQGFEPLVYHQDVQPAAAFIHHRVPFSL